MSLIEIDPSQAKARISRKIERYESQAEKADLWIEQAPVGNVDVRKLIASLDGKRNQLFLKRIFDILGSVVALLFLAPVFLVIAISIKATSDGPVIFRQERWGKNLKKIKIFKFRTMYTDKCDASGVDQTKPDDDRITPLGAYLRRYNLDELPQLLNVLLGDMSLVGPRCHAVGMKASGVLYEQLVPEYHLRHLVLPGLTGLAQVRGLRGPTVRPSKARARIAADLRYIETFSVWHDIKIIVKTLTGSKGSLGF